MKTKKKLIITGTHHTPAIELIRRLQSDPDFNWQIYYFGHIYPQETHILHTIIPKLKVPFYNLNSGKFDRKNILPTIISIPKIIVSFFRALQLINGIKPDLIVSFGGYVSVPVIIAGFFKHVPSITHEQTHTVSLSTRINSFFVNKVALSFPLNFPNSTVTGNLICQEIYSQKSKLFAHIKKPIIYITGGNQGSVFLNQLVVEILPSITNYSIIHQTGKKLTADSNHPRYFRHEYIEIEDIGWVLNQSDIIISRAGANTCQELNALSKKSILIPLPFSQQNEQLLNAKWLKSQHPQITKIINQDNANVDSVLKAIHDLSQEESTSVTTKPSATHPLIDLIHHLVH